jgi:hypothetical protein
MKNSKDAISEKELPAMDHTLDFAAFPVSGQGRQTAPDQAG